MLPAMSLRRPLPWFFVVVFFAASVPAGQEVTVQSTALNRIYPLVGAVLGAVWQLVDRRDLADRLVFPALFLGVAPLVLVAVTSPREQASVDLTRVLFAAGVLAGLVGCEQWLRRRDRLRPKVVDVDPSGTVSPGSAP